jgi:type I restriction enzyme M protein
MKKINKNKKEKANNLSFEAELFKAADKVRGNMEPSDYKHVVLGLIFLKYISDMFTAKYQALLKESPKTVEDRDEYIAENVFWVPKKSRWEYLQENAKKPTIGVLIDDALRALEKDNESLKGVLPKDYARPALNKIMLGELIDLISKIALEKEKNKNNDILGRVYEYFLGRFAGAEGKGGGEFYTPNSVVKLLVETLQPYKGRIYDPCCGSGGMFVQSEKFTTEHGGRIGDIAIYGQESNNVTWRLAKMNLAVRGIDSDIKWNSEGSFHKDEFKDEKFDFILANPPFNVSDWGGERLKEDVRWKYGVPHAGNANYAWLQHIVHHLKPNGRAGIVLANGSMSSNNNNEDAIRKAMLEADLVDVMIALPKQLFFSTGIPACLWFLSKNKKTRKGQVLFIDARKLGSMISRSQSELKNKEIEKITQTVSSWRSENNKYEDIKGYCCSVPLREIAKNRHGLTPGRYVQAEEIEDNDEAFDVRMQQLTEKLGEQMCDGAELDNQIKQKLKNIHFEI